MALDKREVRQAVAPTVGDLGVTGYITTTAAGNANGLTFVTSQFYGYGADHLRNLWILPTSGTQEGKYREIDDFDGTTPASSSTSTIKGTAWSAALASGVTGELYRYDPALYTIAINNAIKSAYQWIFNPALDSSITLTAQDFRYTLPTGITPQMVKRVMTEGNSPYDSQPYYNREDYVFSPDNTEIWFNMRYVKNEVDFTTGKKLYIYAQKYLTELDADTNLTIVTDSTDKIELTKTTDHWRLFLMFCTAEMFTLLAGIASNPDRSTHSKQRDESWDLALKQAPLLAMPAMPTAYSWS